MTTPNTQAPGAAAAAAAKASFGEFEDGDAALAGTIDATNAPEGDVSMGLQEGESAIETDTSTTKGAEAPAEGEQKPGEEKAPEEKPADQSALGEEEFEVGDKKVKVDWRKPEVRKRLVHAAHQRQVLQSKADKAEARAKASEEKANLFDKLNDAWKSGGEDPVASAKALIKQLGGAGGDEIIKRMVKAERELEERVAKMQPHERIAYEAEQRTLAAQRALAEERAKIEKERADSQAKAQAEADRARQSAFDAEFEKVRFSGKIEDEVQAELLDRQIFSAAKSELSELFDKVKEEGGDVSSIDVAKEARRILKRHSDVHRKVVQAKVKAGVTATVADAKAKATSQAQAAMASASSAGTKPKQSIEEIIATQGYAAAFKAARG